MAHIISDWNGYKKISFTIDGRESFIICPKNPLPNNPWVWRAEFFGAFDYADRALLERGWHLAYHRVSDMYGCPESISMMKEFYDVAVNEYKMNPKPAIFGFSRGGLYSVNFALAYPDLVGMLYLDAPVLDVRSWPGGFGAGVGEPVSWEKVKRWYNLTEEEALNFNNNPLDNAEKIAESKIPVFLVCGAVDTAVPYCENGEQFYNRVKAAGGIIEQIVKPDCAHHPHSLAEPQPIVDFIENVILPAYVYDFSHITMNAIGDSITYGTYVDSCNNYVVTEKPWCSIVGEKLGFSKVNNYGINGTSVSSTSSVLPDSAFTLRHADMQDDANLILVAGGTNDFGTSVKLGTADDTTDVSFYGGLRVLCEGLKSKYPCATIVFITPIQRTQISVNGNGNSLSEFRKAINDIAGDVYNFYVIDGSTPDLSCYMNDGTHPTPDGHRVFADYLVSQLAHILSASN